jgi:anti-sigma B factor antagonist
MDNINILSITVEHLPAACVVHLSGDLDLVTADQLRQAAVGELARGSVVLDLAGVAFCDSTGLRVLLDLQRGAEAAGTTLFLAAATHAVSRLFELSGAGDRFSIHPDPGSALGAAAAA